MSMGCLLKSTGETEHGLYKLIMKKSIKLIDKIKRNCKVWDIHLMIHA